MSRRSAGRFGTTPRHWRSPSIRRRRWRWGATHAGGKTRTGSDGQAEKGWDHDPPAKEKVTPFGVLVLLTGALTLVFGSGGSSDFWVDALMAWWRGARSGYRGIRRLVIYLDNGPEDSGRQ